MSETPHSGVALLVTGALVCALSVHFGAVLGIIIGIALLAMGVAAFFFGDRALLSDDTTDDDDDDGWLTVLLNIFRGRGDNR